MYCTPFALVKSSRPPPFRSFFRRKQPFVTGNFLSDLVLWLHFFQTAIHIPEESRHNRRNHPEASGFSSSSLIYRGGFASALKIQLIRAPFDICGAANPGKLDSRALTAALIRDTAPLVYGRNVLRSLSFEGLVDVTLVGIRRFYLLVRDNVGIVVLKCNGITRCRIHSLVHFLDRVLIARPVEEFLSGAYRDGSPGDRRTAGSKLVVFIPNRSRLPWPRSSTSFLPSKVRASRVPSVSANVPVISRCVAAELAMPKVLLDSARRVWVT